MKHLLKHLLLELLLLVVVVRGDHEAGHNIYRDWEDYGAVVLCRNTIQGLKIAQLINCISYCWQDSECSVLKYLKSCRAVSDYFCSKSE